MVVGWGQGLVCSAAQGHPGAGVWRPGFDPTMSPAHKKTPLHSGPEGQICWNFKAKYLSVGLPWWFSGKESAFPEDRLGGRWILHYELVTELGQSQVSTQLGKES